MNIARFTLSIALLTSVACMSARENNAFYNLSVDRYDDSSTPVEILQKTVSIDTTIEQAVKDFDLTDPEDYSIGHMY